MTLHYNLFWCIWWNFADYFIMLIWRLCGCWITEKLAPTQTNTILDSPSIDKQLLYWTFFLFSGVIFSHVWLHRTMFGVKMWSEKFLGLCSYRKITFSFLTFLIFCFLGSFWGFWAILAIFGAGVGPRRYLGLTH